MFFDQIGNFLKGTVKAMKMYLISDNIDTLTGMRLAGVDGVEVHSEEAFRKAFEGAFARKDIGILLITEKLSNEYADIVGKSRLSNKLPLVLAIPDRHGTGRSENFITDYVNSAIGLKL